MYCKWMRLVTNVWKYTNIQYNTIIQNSALPTYSETGNFQLVSCNGITCEFL